MTHRAADEAAELPRWTSRNARDKILMARWVIDQLEAQDEEEIRTVDPDSSRASREFIADHGPQYAAALEEDLAPLKKLLREQYPKLVRFEIFLKPLDRRHGLKDSDVKPKFDGVAVALRDYLPRIRALWKKHYGKVNRPKGDITAMEIAAQYVGVPVRKLERKQKKGGVPVRKLERKPKKGGAARASRR